MRIRITIEYEVQPDHTLADEERDWRQGHVNLLDILDCTDDPNDIVRFEAID